MLISQGVIGKIEFMKIVQSQIKRLQQYFASQKDIVAVYLYGSFAKGGTHKRSDIDFGVLFKRNANLYHRLGQIYADLCDLNLPVEPEVREVNPEKSLIYLRNVIEGRLIYSKDDIVRIRFEVNTMNLFRDTEILRNISNFYMNRRIKEGTYGFRLPYSK